MKNLLSLLFSIIVLTSCGSDDDSNTPSQSKSIEELLESYDLWYVEPDQPSSDFDLGQDAITFSFVNNELYANKNLVGFDPSTMGNIETTYTVEQEGSNASITIDDTEFTIFGVNGNSVKLVNSYDNTTAFYITGYTTEDFPSLEILYYERMPHFFNEYQFWQKTLTENPDENDGDFSTINYVEFFGGRSFRSSEDVEGLTYDEINWEYEGSYRLTTEYGEEESISNELIFIYNTDEGEEEIPNDTLKVNVVDESKIQFSEPGLNINYTFEGTINTPF